VCEQNNQPQTEVCDGIDNNCDGTPDDGLSADNDGDGHYAPGSCALPDDDCDDNNAAIWDCNTPVSDDPFTVSSDDGTVDITFPNVTEGGDTNITVERCNLDQLDGMGMTSPNTPCIDVQTDVGWDDMNGMEWIQVCINYDDTGMTLAQEQALSVVRCDGAVPPTCDLLAKDPDVVPNPNTDTNDICVLTDHFSYLAVGEPTDGDEDGTPDLLDNCPDVSNFFQRDTDEDGVGNACDKCPDTPAGVPVDDTGCEIAGVGFKGDMNSDDIVDISDVIRVLRIALHLDPPAVCADINEDGVVDISDVIRTLRMALGLDVYQKCI
jgi:hypothetical protein